MCSASQPPRLSFFCVNIRLVLLQAFVNLSAGFTQDTWEWAVLLEVEAGDGGGATSLRDGHVAVLMCGHLCEYVSSHFCVSADGRVVVKVNERGCCCCVSNLRWRWNWRRGVTPGVLGGKKEAGMGGDSRWQGRKKANDAPAFIF